MDNLKEQFSKIYDEYIDKIYRFVYVKVSSPEVAQDITSKVFLKSWEAYQKAPQIQNISAFLYQVARNAITDHYRVAAGTKTVSTENAQLADTRTNLHEKAVLSADMEVIKKAILNLKKDYQDILIWHYLEDMSTEQIAQILNKPPGTVRVMIHRGLKYLKDELHEEA